MTEELYFKLLEASMHREEYFATNAILLLILCGVIPLMIYSGIAYFSENYCYKSNKNFPKLVYPSTFITIILLIAFIYNARQCSAYPERRDIEQMIKDLDKIKKINTKTEENK